MDPSPLRVSRTSSVAVVALAVLIGCASPQRSATARKSSVETLPDGTQLVCQMEKPTGSHIPEQVCRRVVPGGADRTRIQNQFATPKSAGDRPAN